jgi:hypothetical protein
MDPAGGNKKRLLQALPLRDSTGSMRGTGDACEGMPHQGGRIPVNAHESF